MISCKTKAPPKLPTMILLKYEGYPRPHTVSLDAMMPWAFQTHGQNQTHSGWNAAWLALEKTNSDQQGLHSMAEMQWVIWPHQQSPFMWDHWILSSSRQMGRQIQGPNRVTHEIYPPQNALICFTQLNALCHSVKF